MTTPGFHLPLTPFERYMVLDDRPGYPMTAMAHIGFDGQYVGADVYAGWGSWGLFAQRQVVNNDAFYEAYAATHDSTLAHDVAASVGGRTMVFTRGLEVQLEAVITRELNRYMELRNTVWNAHLGVTLGWRPR